MKDGTVLNGDLRLIGTYADTFSLGVIAATHTRSQNEYTDSLQNTTSINTQREIRIGRLAYKHDFNKTLCVYIGITDMEDWFNITPAANWLVNSAFSNSEALNLTTQLASFPYPGFGAMLQYQQDNTYGLFGIYQGNPQYQKTVFTRGYMLIGEAGTTLLLHDKVLKNLFLQLGVWVYEPESIPGYVDAQGFYLTAQTDWQYRTHPMQAFAQFAYSHESPSYIPYSIILGANAQNIFCKDKREWLSFGIGKIWIHNFPSEVVYELCYIYRFAQNYYFTADLQYITKPSGIHPNATVCLFRFSYMLGKS